MNEWFPRAVPSNERQLVVVVRFRQSFLYVMGATLVSIGSSARRGAGTVDDPHVIELDAAPDNKAA